MPTEENVTEIVEEVVETPEVEVPEVEAEDKPEKEEKPVKEKKEKKAKPEAGKGRKDKGKGKAKGAKAQSEAQAWWDEFGADLKKKGHGHRNIILRAGRKAGLQPTEAIAKFRDAEGTFEERVAAVFD